MKQIFILLSIILFFAGCCTVNKNRETILLDDNWQFINHEVAGAEKPELNTESWETVSVPHDWAIKGPFDKEIDKQTVAVVQDQEKVASEKTGRTGALPHIGIGWYRKSFELPEFKKGKQALLVFDGAMSDAQIFVNGVKVGNWPYGYSYFYFDISNYLKDGENLLAVRLENKPFSSRWYPGAGIYRKVQIIVKDEVNFEQWGTFLTTPFISEDVAKVNIKSKVNGQNIKVVTEIKDADGKVVATNSTTEIFGNLVEQNIAVPNPKIWDIETPYLYTAHFTSPQKPNIILINIDDMGWRDVGFMGSKYYETPNIDKLAGKGMIFTNAYAAAANCAPSRACLMSGEWTPRHGIYTVGNSDRGKSKDRKLIPTPNNEYMPANNVLLPAVLKDNGYVTCHAGKWHLSDDPRSFGFDVNIGGSHAGSPGSYYPPYKNVPSLNAPTDDYYLTDLVMDKSLDFVRSVQGKPFFLYYSPYAVHTPIQPVKSLLSKYENKAEWNGQHNANYATMVENVDTQIGRLIDFLESSGKIDNTFILFTSDNGGHYGITCQLPLRSGKGSYYEGGIREPMFAYWKGNIRPGTQSDIPVTNIDFYPTILEVAGANKPLNKQLDGISIVPLLKEEGTIEVRPLFWHFPIYLQAYLKNDTTTQDPLFRTRPGSVIRFGNWKLIQYFENNDLELYNLKKDIGEKNNLAKSNPEKTQELLDLLEKWRNETNAPVPTALNPDYVAK